MGSGVFKLARMVSVHPLPFCSVGPQTKFSKRGRGLGKISIFRGGLLGKRRVTFFRRVVVLT